MKLSKTKRNHSLGFVMTPMIDIVFLLIVFFLTVSQFAQVDQYPLSLAKVSEGAEESSPTEITIHLDVTGIIIVSGKEFTIEQTTQGLRALLQRNGNQPSRLRVELRCDRRCPTDSVNRMMKQLSELGFSQVYLSVAGEQQ